MTDTRLQFDSCPFCGGEATWNPEWKDDSLGYVSCKECLARTGSDLDTFADAQRKWNTRPEHPIHYADVEKYYQDEEPESGKEGK